jgi:hypothetical protein
MRQGLSQGNPDKTVMPTCLGGSTAAIPTAELREGSGYGMMTLVEDQGGSREDKTTTTLKRSKGKKKDDRFHNNYKGDNGWARMDGGMIKRGYQSVLTRTTKDAWDWCVIAIGQPTNYLTTLHTFDNADSNTGQDSATASTPVLIPHEDHAMVELNRPGIQATRSGCRFIDRLVAVPEEN